VEKRESKSRNDSGIVYFRHYGINQRDEVVCDARRAGLMLKRSTADAAV
jgi:acyl dehydratase